LAFNQVCNSKVGGLTLSVTIWVLMSTMFLTNIGFGVILPTLPFLSQSLGASTFEMGLALSVFALAQLCASFFWGGVSDRIGRRHVLIMGIVGYGVVSALLAFVPNVTVLLILRFLGGVMAAAVFPSSLALVSECTTREQRPRILGYMGSVNGIGFICGPPVGVFLSVFGIQAPFVCVGILAIINGLLALRLLPRERSQEDLADETEATSQLSWIQRLSQSLLNRMVAPFLFGTFIIFLVDASITATLSYFIIGSLQSTPTMAGWAFMINAGVSALAQATMFNRIFNRFGDALTIVIGFTFGVVGYSILGFSNYLAWAFSGLALLSLSRGLAYPAITTSISLRTPKHLQGSGFGSQSTVGSLARMLGPLIAGWLFAHDERSPYYFSSVILFVSIGFYLIWMYRMRKAVAGDHQLGSGK
jgi:DHA1 family multidrug resistance protein-like MFS transporter